MSKHIRWQHQLSLSGDQIRTTNWGRQMAFALGAAGLVAAPNASALFLLAGLTGVLGFLGFRRRRT